MADHVDLDLPLSARYASTIRAVAASMAVEVGLSIDEIDDLRLGVNEAISVVTDVDDGSTGRLHVTFVIDAESIRVSASRSGVAEPLDANAVDVLATRILNAVVDEFGVDEGVFTVVKRIASDVDAA